MFAATLIASALTCQVFHNATDLRDAIQNSVIQSPGPAVPVVPPVEPRVREVILKEWAVVRKAAVKKARAGHLSNYDRNFHKFYREGIDEFCRRHHVTRQQLAMIVDK